MFYRLLSRLSLNLKLLLLLSVFVFPLLFLAYYIVSIEHKNLEYTRGEIDGSQRIRIAYQEIRKSTSLLEIENFANAISKVSTESSLVLDPDGDAYFLQRAITEYGAEMLVALSKITHEKNQVDTDHYTFLLQSHLIVEFFRSIENAQNSDAKYYGESTSLQKFGRDASHSRESFLNDISLINSDGAKNKEHAEALKEKIINYSITAIDELDTLLNVRVRAINSNLNRAIIILITSFIFLPLFSWMIVRNINHRLSNLMKVMSQAGSHGDLRITCSDDGKDEIHQLALCFNAMIDNVREVVRQIGQSGGLVHHSTVEIAASSKQQQATTSEIAATSAQIEATSKRICATADSLSVTMQEVQSVASDTASLANDGHSSLARMKFTMHGINEACQGIAKKLEALNQKATRIGDVVVTIAKVADQTNLLSLNAAIEAEKAGEYGHGFSVVAREIRRLADQTAIATVDIEQMVKEIQGAVAAGVMGMEKFASDVRSGATEVETTSDQLSLIIGQIQTLTPSFHTVSDGMQHQAMSAKQITEGLSQLSIAVRQTAESLTQSNISIDQLHQATVILEKEVQRFQV